MACSPSPPVSLAGADFVVYELDVDDGSQRGLAVKGEMLVVSGTGGYVAWSDDDPQQSWTSLEIESSLDYRDVEILNDGTIVVMSAGPGPRSRILGRHCFLEPF